MKALSLTQPWASLVAIGAKRIETRSWGTACRGWLAIHAAKSFPSAARDFLATEPFHRVLREAMRAGLLCMTDDELPLGKVVAVVNLHTVGRIGRRADGAVIVQTQELPVEGDELAFGDYTPGRFGWRLSNVWRLPEPVACKGALGLWELPPDVEAAVREQLAGAKL